MRQNGNALFLILIAVALFAALSYAVTQSGRGGGSIDREQAEIQAAQITQFYTSVDTAIYRMQLSGIAETDICFYTGSNDVAYNYAACSDPGNLVFGNSGGGINYVPPPTGANDGTDWYFTGDNRINGLASTAYELSVVLENISLEVCNAINKGLGHSFSTIPDPINTWDGTDPFAGTYLSGSGEIMSQASVVGLTAFCFEEQTTGNLFFIGTLIER